MPTIFGQGSNGTAGSAGTSGFYCNVGGGGGGGGLGYKNNITVTPGNSYTVVVGQGEPGQTFNSGNHFRIDRPGGGGAVRIVWPGNTRQFPSTCVASP